MKASNLLTLAAMGCMAIPENPYAYPEPKPSLIPTGYFRSPGWRQRQRRKANRRRLT